MCIKKHRRKPENKRIAVIHRLKRNDYSISYKPEPVGYLYSILLKGFRQVVITERKELKICQ